MINGVNKLKNRWRVCIRQRVLLSDWVTLRQLGLHFLTSEHKVHAYTSAPVNKGIRNRDKQPKYRSRGSGLNNSIVHIDRSHAGLCGVKWEVFCSYLVTSSSWESLLILSHYVALGTMTEKECAEKPIKFGDWGRRNGESTRLPPLRPGFVS